MNIDHPTHDTPEHEEISALLPWYVNGTIAEFDRRRVELHLRACSTCREDLEQERRVYQQMAAEIGVEYMPRPSLKRLQAKLDSLDAPTLPADPPVERSNRRTVRGLLAASIAGIAIVLSLSAINRWMPFRPTLQPDYYTVTTTAARPSDEVIRAVFSPTVTLIELQGILDEAQLRIISGPTEAGVYSLAATTTRPVDSSLAMLRRHPTVRFAESTRTVPVPGPAPGPGAPR
jgi:hypothetical protein